MVCSIKHPWPGSRPRFTVDLPESLLDRSGSELNPLLAEIEREVALLAPSGPPNVRPFPRNRRGIARMLRRFGWGKVLDAAGGLRAAARPQLLPATLKTAPGSQECIGLWIEALFGETARLQTRRNRRSGLLTLCVEMAFSPARPLPDLRVLVAVLRELTPAHILVDEREISLLTENP